MKPTKTRGWLSLHHFSQRALNGSDVMIYMFGISRLWIVWDSNKPAKRVVQTSDIFGATEVPHE